MAQLPELNVWMAQLVEQGMYDSACLLGEFLPASVNTCVHYADALVGKGEHRRAIAFYREALQGARSKAARNSSGGTLAAEGPDSECDIKLRIAKCHLAGAGGARGGTGRDVRSAITSLESIPLRSCAPAASLLLGKLYQTTGIERAAQAAYKEVVRLQPMAIEAAVALAQLGVPVREILSAQPLHASLPWLVQLLHAHSAAGVCDFSRAHEAFSALASHFERSPHVLLHCARAAALRGREEEALSAYARLRKIDSSALDGIDRYALLLAGRERLAELNVLCTDILACDRSRPEPWVAVAVFWSHKGERARALEYCERALTLDDRHACAHQLKGSLLLASSRPEQAIYSLRKANAIRGELECFVALVDAYTRVEMTREALAAAREAAALMPNCARAHALIGRVLLAMPYGANKARREEIHSKLGEMHALNKNFAAALMHFQHALALNANLVSANEGLERIEKLIRAVDKGLDPIQDEMQDDRDELEEY
ncbi:hypothetical protein T492DRAFT_1093075 [Pavlovales sp. CCMP2436]|nr:hypothetical protein T492DRAFT_1093075 [Pavlovales sp. CCMP2436]